MIGLKLKNKIKIELKSIFILLIILLIFLFIFLTNLKIVKIEELKIDTQFSFFKFIFVLTFLSLADSINPCIISLLVIMIATLASMKIERKEIIIRATIFTLTIFFTYFILGLLMYFGLSLIYLAAIASNLFNFIKIFLVLLLIIAGIINIKDGILSKESIFSIPKRFKPTIDRLLRFTTVTATVFLAIIVTLVEFPCTGLFYVGVISFLHSLKAKLYEIILILGYYNTIFILPEILIVLLLMKGSEPKNIYEKIYRKHRNKMRIIGGIAMIFLALFIWLYMR